MGTSKLQFKSYYGLFNGSQSFSGQMPPAVPWIAPLGEAIEAGRYLAAKKG
jgi:hypothetical protein